MMKKRGFTLVEIMLVVGIVIILVTLAMPSILRSRITANEGAAMANLKTIENSCQLFHIAKQTYPSSLEDLTSPASDPPYIDSVLAQGKKQGYQFVYNLADPDHFTLNANPTTTGFLRGRFFYVDELGSIRAKLGSQAGTEDEAVR
ncbi:MAG: prepilin-type N-terminal cleavage/methylation domain-containing protein [Candidatus Omnitrophica bacterium]|nr:prepilin-type N-terminal cleavage/methylation domain-containing protein [Candidatus Omnitrophota bacterium]